MRSLSEILKSLDAQKIIGRINIPIAGISFDSRSVKNGDLFVAVKGLQSDGHKYINNVVENAVSAVVCENLPEQISNRVTYIVVEDTSKALGVIASAFYDNPSSKLKLIGVTGTNGKTTTVTLLYNLFINLGYRVGVLSTVRNYINDKKIKATHTTPDAVQINKLLEDMVAERCEYCFMEVSSHAIDQNRIEGLNYTGAIFTNITHDHLDYHKSFAKYINAKKSFFDNLNKNAFVLVNSDDKNGKIMVQNTKAVVKSYGIKSFADFKVRILENHFDGSLLNIENVDIWTHFVGEFNAYNLLSVYACAVMLNQENYNILTAISNLKPVEGRFETIKSENNITAIIDYAHTPDALLNVLNAINKILKNQQKLITVVGTGGDRDKTKRPEMAKIAIENSYKVVFTSDNPRSENPSAIIDDMKVGLEDKDKKKVLTVINRREAIRTACFLAKENDIILVAGKGHETYQEINGVKNHFDDREEVRVIFNELNN
ncbi:MAG: UDP-N-acetylmuramoyl-L-alanyl-D-glutamate--2,6-diaminopimelate ligase [Bacteroidales bacterium]|nr:UDP-N-acetylmuramoyl-L-alanyl-D-glutamate--2,6-diaminopimelate ligase [Bacteroidales bacterium]